MYSMYSPAAVGARDALVIAAGSGPQERSRDRRCRFGTELGDLLGVLAVRPGQDVPGGQVDTDHGSSVQHDRHRSFGTGGNDSALPAGHVGFPAQPVCAMPVDGGGERAGQPVGPVQLNHGVVPMPAECPITVARVSQRADLSLRMVVAMASPDADRATDTASPRAFISYAHDSQEHKEDVRLFARLLMANGIDVDLDQWEEGERKDWSRWATEGILGADYVLVIASPQYAAVGDGIGPITGNHGARAEALTLRNLQHTDPHIWEAKLLPVILPGNTVTELPHFVAANIKDHYQIRALSKPGIEDLVRVITKQRRRVKPPLGEVPHLLPEREPDLDDERQATEASLVADVNNYVVRISPICLGIRSRLAEVESDLGHADMSTPNSRAASVRTLRMLHQVLEASWHQLSAVPLPIVGEDRKRIREWQDSYLQFKDSLGRTVRQLHAIVSDPGIVSFLFRPLITLPSLLESQRLMKRFKHQCELLGIPNPLD